MAKTSPGAIKAGEAFVEIGTDLRPLDKGMAQVSAKLKNLSKQMRGIGIGLTAAGVALAAPLIAATKAFTDFGDQVAKMARRTGFSTEAISELGFAAQISGADLGGLEKAVRRMSRAVIEALDGMTEYTRAFERIGLNVETLRGQSPEDVFLSIGRAIASITDPMLQAAAAQEIFGRSGTMLLPLFAAGAQGIEELRARARELGISLSAEAALGAEQLADAMLELKSSVMGIAIAIGTALAPVVVEFTDGITTAVTKVVTWAKRNPALVKSITQVAGATAALSIGLGALALAIAGVSAAMAILAANPIALVIGAVAALVIATVGYVAVTEVMAEASADAGDAAKQMAADQQAAAAKTTTAVNQQLSELAKLAGALDDASAASDRFSTAGARGGDGFTRPKTFLDIELLGPRRAAAQAQFQIQTIRQELLRLGDVQSSLTDEIERTRDQWQFFTDDMSTLASDRNKANAAEIGALADQLALQERILGVAQKLLGTEADIGDQRSIRTGIRVAAAGFGGQGQLAGTGAREIRIQRVDIQKEQLDALKSIDSKLGPGSRIPFQGALTPAVP